MTMNAKNLGLSCLLAILAGCATETPPDYSPNYSYVPVAGGGSGKTMAGSMLVPNACLGPPADVEEQGAGQYMNIIPSLGSHLPPGCANAYNLQRMAESQRDLIEGRQMGPAPASPTVRAARRYIDDAPREAEMDAEEYSTQ